jgi:hypothetical protein
MTKRGFIMGFALLFLLFYYSVTYAEERVVQYDMTFIATQPDILLKLYAASVNQDQKMLSLGILPNTNYALLKVKIDGKIVKCYGYSDAFVPKR